MQTSQMLPAFGAQYPGAYVPAAMYRVNQPGMSGQSSRFRLPGGATPGSASWGMSSREVAQCGGKSSCGSSRARELSIHPFDDTVIDSPRDLAFIDLQRGDQTFITTRFNQSTDLRGDVPIRLQGAPPGARLSTHGPYAMTKPYRGYVY